MSMTIGEKHEQGFIALLSAMLMTALLITLTYSVNLSGFSSRSNLSYSEYKELSLALAEACARVVLLKITQNYNYMPGAGGEPISVGAESCIIESVHYAVAVNNSKKATIEVKAQHKQVFTRIELQALVYDPLVAAPPSQTTEIISWLESP